MNLNRDTLRGVIVALESNNTFHVKTFNSGCYLCTPRGLLKKQKRKIKLQVQDMIQFIVKQNSSSTKLGLIQNKSFWREEEKKFIDDFTEEHTCDIRHE
jgi:hypothetical protein